MARRTDMAITIQCQKYDTGNNNDNLIVTINMVKYTKMPSSLYGNNVEHINDSRETSGITFRIWHAISL